MSAYWGKADALRSESGRRIERNELDNADECLPIRGNSAVARLLRSIRSAAPGDECFLERSFSGRALLDGQNGPATVVVDDRDVEPGALLQQFHVALHIALGRRDTVEKESGLHLHGKPCQWRAAGMLALSHQNGRDIRNAAQGKIGGEIEYDFDRMVAGSALSVLRRTD